jgi:hypothetical protein
MRMDVHHLPLRVFDPERQLRESGRRPRGVGRFMGLKVYELFQRFKRFKRLLLVC